MTVNELLLTVSVNTRRRVSLERFSVELTSSGGTVSGPISTACTALGTSMAAMGFPLVSFTAIAPNTMYVLRGDVPSVPIAFIPLTSAISREIFTTSE